MCPKQESIVERKMELKLIYYFFKMFYLLDNNLIYNAYFAFPLYLSLSLSPLSLRGKCNLFQFIFSFQCVKPLWSSHYFYKHFWCKNLIDHLFLYVISVDIFDSIFLFKIKVDDQSSNASLMFFAFNYFFFLF